MYELAYSYYAKGDLESALHTARAGSHYRTSLLPQLHMLIGNVLDDQRKSADAITVYREAIKQEPDFALLHFNLGLSLFRTGNFADAKTSLERSVVLDPAHASSHLALATLYEKLSYPVPSIMALSRFLLIEQNSSRSQAALTALRGLIGGNVTRNSDTGNLTIQLTKTGKSNKDEGDFDGIDLAFSIATAAAQMENQNKGSTPFKLLAGNYSVMAELLSQRKRKGFAMEYYSPFFIEMDKQKMTDAFAFRVHQAEKMQGMSEWAQSESDKLHAFDAWLKDYSWPKLK
jgi:tetratricopeptide (TPR) repeat protein